MSGIPDAALRRLRDQLSGELRPAMPRLVADRYETRELLGRGGMGEVHRVTDRLLGRDVAIKVLAATDDTAFTERLRREARVLAKLEHPGVVPVHDAGVLEDGRPFYVMRLVDGSRLDDFARGPTGRGELLRTMLRIADAVAFAHDHGIIHRDLKPGNVMIGPFGEVLVLDWGIAKVITAPRGEVAPGDPHAPEGTRAHAERSANGPPSPDPITAAGTAVGTPGYMAPEQARGESSDHRADVYALGVMLHELLAMPSHGEAPRPLMSIVARATAPGPDERYQSVAGLAADIRRWLDGERVLAHREGVMERAGRFARRHATAILLLLAYAVIRTLILLWRGI